jgi:drug/metabolite transporter (DMT)-like permease
VGNRFSEVKLQAAKTWILGVMYTVWFAVDWVCGKRLWPGWRNGKAWLLLAYSAVATGALADILQQKGQAVATPSETNVILSLEPVFAVLTAWLVLGEKTSGQESAGGSLILLAALLASC